MVSSKYWSLSTSEPLFSVVAVAGYSSFCEGTLLPLFVVLLGERSFICEGTVLRKSCCDVFSEKSPGERDAASIRGLNSFAEVDALFTVDNFFAGSGGGAGLRLTPEAETEADAERVFSVG